jgi:hypothetical protein
MRMLDEPKTIVYNFPILVLDIWQKTTGLSSSKCFLCATLEKGTELFECRQDQRTKIKPCLGAYRMLQVKREKKSVGCSGSRHGSFSDNNSRPLPPRQIGDTKSDFLRVHQNFNYFKNMNH